MWTDCTCNCLLRGLRFGARPCDRLATTQGRSGGNHEERGMRASYSPPLLCVGKGMRYSYRAPGTAELGAIQILAPEKSLFALSQFQVDHVSGFCCRELV
jgi:hypothetical protein